MIPLLNFLVFLLLESEKFMEKFDLCINLLMKLLQFNIIIYYFFIDFFKFLWK